MSVSPNESVVFNDAVAGCTGEVYHAVRAVDSAGNTSSFVADEIVTIEYVPAQPGAPAPGAPAAPGVPAEGGEVAGEETGPEGDGTDGEDGDVLGEEEEKDTDGDGIPDSEDDDDDGDGIKDEDEKDEEEKTDAERSRDIVRYVLIIGGVIILIGGGIAAFRFFSRPQA